MIRSLTDEELEGYLICLQDKYVALALDIESTKEALKWRKKFSNPKKQPKKIDMVDGEDLGRTIDT